MYFSIMTIDCCYELGSSNSLNLKKKILRLVWFSRVFWYNLLRKFGLHSLSPQQAETSFFGWWERSSAQVLSLEKKGLDSLIALGAWMI